GAFDTLDFVVEHRTADFGHLDREQPTKTAALIRTRKLVDGDAFNAAGKRLRLRTEIEQPVAMTGMVERDFDWRQFCADVGDAQPIDLIFCEFPYFVCGLLRFCFPFGIAFEEFRVVVAHHRSTATGRANDHLCVVKYGQEVFGDGFGVVPEAGIERRLTTAGLVKWKTHLDAEMFENLDHRDASFRV